MAAASISMSVEAELPESSLVPYRRDTLKVTDLNGREVLIMKAVKDETTGEMVASDQLDAAVVVTRFRNVAERLGSVELEFSIIVPAAMQDSRWQLRFHPDMYMLGDSVRLDDLMVTGARYRKEQLRGYQRYARFLDRIASDSLEFVDMRSLELFIKRNIPLLYAFRQDSTYVSDDEFESAFGVTGHDALEHYTNKLLKWRNAWLISQKDKRLRRYVKSPLATEGVRLDTVIRDAGGNFSYNYVASIKTRPGLRNVSIVLGGEIYDRDVQVYSIPRTEPLTFYISSLSFFADMTPRYQTRIISRNAQADAACRIDFMQGSSEIDESLGRNRIEAGTIRKTLKSLLTNENYLMDSIVIIASASPEGDFKQNLSLSYRRAKSVSGFFERYVEHLKDSLREASGLFIDAGLPPEAGRKTISERSFRDISFLSRSGGENWASLDMLIESDSLLSERDKAHYKSLETCADPDEREAALKRKTYYKYLKDKLYPELRTVNFSFHLHRRGMIKDTVHTSVLDSIYMEGVQALADHDYELAVKLLAPYQDYNAAVAQAALGRDKSALSILGTYPRTAKVDYLLAVLYSRSGDDRSAIEHYLSSCRQERSFVHRGNLDPEISSLIKRYGLDKRLEEEDRDEKQGML